MSEPITDIFPVDPLELPVMVSPTIKSPLGIVVVKAELTMALIVAVSPLVPPVIVSPTVKEPEIRGTVS